MYKERAVSIIVIPFLEERKKKDRQILEKMVNAGSA